MGNSSLVGDWTGLGEVAVGRSSLVGDWTVLEVGRGVGDGDGGTGAGVGGHGKKQSTATSAQNQAPFSHEHLKRSAQFAQLSQ